MKEELLSQEEPELKDLESSQSAHINKEICAGVSHRFKQPPLQKLGIEVRLFQQRQCQLELKGKRKWDRMKDGCGISFILTGLDDRAIWL